MYLPAFQSYLDELSRCVLHEDFDAYANAIILPFPLTTARATIWVRTRDELEEGFEAQADMMRDLQVTAIDRRADDMLETAPDMLVGSYQTHTLRGSDRVVASYPSVMTLRRHEGLWKAAALSNQTRNERWPVLLPKVGDPI